MRFRRIGFHTWALVGMLVGLSGARPVCAFEVNPANTIPGTVANSLIVNGDGGDWNTAVLLIELTQGELYNDPNFDSLAQQQNIWGFVPELEFDSWVGIPGDATGSTLGSAGDLGDFGPAVIDDQKASVTWFNTDSTNTAPVRIANMTITDDAFGTWSTIVGFSGGVLLSESGFVINGVMGLTPPQLSGDLDGDGFVGINDLNIILTEWNLSVPPGNPSADSSGDGFVGIDDLNTVLGNWNAGPPTSTVPEPGTFSLLSAAALTLMRRKRSI